MSSELTEAFRAAAGALGLSVALFEWSGEATGTGLERNAFYLIRPDGYVALASSVQDAAILIQFRATRELAFDGGATL